MHIPPLNQRREDIPLLYTHFLREFAGQYQREVPEVPREHIERLVSRAWRGNVRELRNAAERHVLGIGGGAATPDGETSRRKPLPEQMDDVEATFIRSALAESNGNIQAAADALGIPRRTLNEKMRRYNLERKDFG